MACVFFNVPRPWLSQAFVGTGFVRGTVSPKRSPAGEFNRCSGTASFSHLRAFKRRLSRPGSRRDLSPVKLVLMSNHQPLGIIGNHSLETS